MRKVSILTSAFWLVSVLGFQAASAQITLRIPEIPRIPRIPKINKPKREATKPEPPKTDDNQAVGHDQSSEPKSSSPDSTQEEAMDFRLTFFLDEIAKANKQADEYSPEAKLRLVSGDLEEWLLRAVSARAREKWGKQWLTTPTARKRFTVALDALAASAAKKFPIYKPEPKNFAFHNLAEEKMMKETLDNLATLKILKIGLGQINWLIDKNDYGLPTARYKQGYVWLRDPADDHPYCHLYFINIIQDYSGGGTYGARYAKSVGDGLFGCPAGQ